MSSEADNNSGNHSSQESLPHLESEKTSDEAELTPAMAIKPALKVFSAKLTEINAGNLAWMEKMSTRLIEVEEIAERISNAETEDEDLEKTGDNLQKCVDDLTEIHEWFVLEVPKWALFTLKELRELKEFTVNMRNTCRVDYESSEIKEHCCFEEIDEQFSLMLKGLDTLEANAEWLMNRQNKLGKTMKAIIKQKEIDITLRKNLVVEYVQLYKESKLENLLTKKEDPEKNEKRFDSSQPTVTLTQQMPTFAKDDLDTMPISRSVIDSLIEPEILGKTGANDYAQDDDQPLDAAVLDPKNRAFTVREDHQMLLNDQKASNPVAKDDKQRLEGEPALDEHSDMQETGKHDSSNISEENRAESEYSLNSKAPKKKHGREFLAESNPPLQQSELGKTEMKKQRTMNVEKVQLNITSEKTEKQEPFQEDSH